MKTLILFLSILGLNLYLNIRCSSNPTAKGDPYECTPGPTGGTNCYSEAYLVSPGTPSNRVDVEYRSYYFIPNETRKIIAYGNDGGNNWTDVWCTYNSQHFIGEIGRGVNKLRSGNVFTVPLEITAKGFVNPNGETVTIHAGNYPNSMASFNFDLYVVPKREFNIQYSCMSNHNIFSNTVGYDTKNSIISVFGEANTKFLEPVNHNLSLMNEDIDFGGPSQLFQRAREWINNNIPGGWENFPDKTVWLLGCKNFTTTDPNNIFISITFPFSYGDGRTARVSFIFTERGIYVGTGQNDLERQEVTCITIHELGHARGMKLNSSHGYPNGDITSPEHIKGHNGKNNGFCLMRVPGNSYDPNYIQYTFYRTTVEDPHFCFGHIQILYNCIW